MRLIDFTAATPDQNVALDEALLEQAESAGADDDLLRLWEAEQPIVVVGRASKIAEEVELEACHRAGVPVLRRASGGCAVVAGPGCLMYGLVLSVTRHPELRDIDRVHAFVLERIEQQLRAHQPDVQRAGISDLAVGPATDRKKFSGNSLRMKREHVLYHGTMLYGFPLELIGRYLKQPQRQPGYRERRPHDAFVTNLPLARAIIVDSLVKAFGAERGPVEIPGELVARLIKEKYSRDDWNLRH